MAQFWLATGQATKGMTPRERNEFWASIRRWLSIEGVMHATEGSVDIAINGRVAPMVQQVRNVDGSVVPIRLHNVWTHDAGDVTSFADRLREISKSDGNPAPVVHSASVPSMRPRVAEFLAHTETVSNDAGWLTIDVRSNADALLTRPVFQDGHWTVRYTAANSDGPDSASWRSLPVHRVDYLMQGVLLPAGNWRVEFRYSPWWLGWSLGISAVAWVSVAYASSLRRLRRPR